MNRFPCHGRGHRRVTQALTSGRIVAALAGERITGCNYRFAVYFKVNRRKRPPPTQRRAP